MHEKFCTRKTKGKICIFLNVHIYSDISNVLLDYIYSIYLPIICLMWMWMLTGTELELQKCMHKRHIYISIYFQLYVSNLWKMIYMATYKYMVRKLIRLLYAE